MNISLTPELEAYVVSKVQTGRYTSASEVVREGLRLLEEQDQLTQLRRERLRQLIDEGMADLRAGRSAILDSNEMSAIKTEARASAEKR